MQGWSRQGEEEEGGWIFLGLYESQIHCQKTKHHMVENRGQTEEEGVGLELNGKRFCTREGGWRGVHTGGARGIGRIFSLQEAMCMGTGGILSFLFWLPRGGSH